MSRYVVPAIIILAGWLCVASVCMGISPTKERVSERRK